LYFRRTLEKLLCLFRATIQHGRYLRLLVSGAAPFDELDIIWSDNFINVQELQIGFLQRDDALALLTKPIPNFPDTAIPLTVAKAIYERVNGQPYLLQLYGFLLVSHLNEQNQQTAHLEEVAMIEQQVLSQARNIINTAPETVQTALEALALGKTPELKPRYHRWLKRRYLLNDKNKLNIPVLGEWIKN